MAKANLDGAIVYWVERGSATLQSKVLTRSDIFRGGTYESEVSLKHASDPIEIQAIPLARAGEDWAKAEVERLKQLAATQSPANSD